MSKRKIINTEKAIALYKEGLSSDKVGEILGCCGESILKILHKNNIPLRMSASERSPRYDNAYIVTEYQKGRNTKNIASELGTYNTTIRRILMQSGITPRTTSEVWDKRSILFDAPSNVEEPNYWIGFLSADGAVFGTRISLTLAEKDKQMVYKFSEFCNSHVRTILHKKFNVVQYSTSFHSSKNVEFLKSIGITEKKSKTIKLNIPFNRHILRGVLDGDGHVSKKGLISIASASIEFTNQLSEYLKSEQIKHTITKAATVYLVNVLAIEEVKRFYHLVYDDATIFLQRKKDRMSPLLAKAGRIKNSVNSGKEHQQP